MHRRTVLLTGLTALVAGVVPGVWTWRWHGGDVAHDAAIRMLSDARRTAQLQPLVPAPALLETARRQALHMARVQLTSHLSPDRQTPDGRARQAGFEGRVLGESLAETYEGPEETMAAWLSQPSTRDVLMDPKAVVFGLASEQGHDARNWMSLVTGA